MIWHLTNIQILEDYNGPPTIDLMLFLDILSWHIYGKIWMIIVSILLPDIEVFLKVNEHKTRGSKKIFGTHENKKKKKC